MASGPFSNGDDGDIFVGNRCEKCRHRFLDDDGPCEDFMPAWFDEWPEILFSVEVSAANPVGVECSRFEHGDPSHPPTSEVVRATLGLAPFSSAAFINLDVPPYAAEF